MGQSLIGAVSNVEKSPPCSEIENKKLVTNKKIEIMKTNTNFSIQKDFVLNGRFTVTSFRTGKRYFVEPIENEHTPVWGDVNPATGKIEGSYGSKHRGGSKEKESLITKENGFKNITYSGVGCSPFDVIEKLDAKYPTLVN